jgi:glycosyltransferase involved in cell wall biosynthesis
LYYRLRDKLYPEGSRRRSFAKRLFYVLRRVGKAPLRELPPLYSLDRLKINGRNLNGFGWLFHKHRHVSSVKLIVGSGSERYSLSTCYGTDRPDVAMVYDHAGARSCGFSVAGKLPFEKPSTFALEVDYQDGGKHVLPIRPPGAKFKLVGVRITRHRLLSGAKALLRADIGSVLRRIREERASQSNHYCRFEDVLQLLDEQSPDDRSSSPGPAGSSKRGVPRIERFLHAAKQSRSSERKFVLVIDHNLGGGANKYRRELIRQILKRDRPVLLLYYDLPELTYVVSYIDTDSAEMRFLLNSVVSLQEMRDKVDVEEIFVNNVYSFDSPLFMAALICDLKKALNASVTVAIHDYFQICPSYTLLNEVGTFCGIPELTRCEECLPNNHGEFSLLAEDKDIRRWRTAWRLCLEEAAKILCFSEASARLLQRAYSTLDREKIVVIPHLLDRAPAKKPRLDLKGDLNIGVVGNIAAHKGADVVTELAALIQRRKLAARITVLGTINSRLPEDVATVTGSYDVEELPDLIEKHHVNIFLFPSIWPETFSYVCEELMALEVPLAVFNIGAPPERVAQYRRGLILDGVTVEQTLDKLIGFQEVLRQDELIGQGR